MLKDKRFILPLIGIIVVYSIYYLFFEGYYYWGVPRKVKHIGRVLSVLGVYGIGTWSLRKVADAWMMNLWHLVHTVLIAVLIIMGAYDWTIQTLSYPIKRFAASIHEFLISPIFYIGMWILKSKLPGEESSDC
jgi:hypothetical protein